MVDKKVPGRKGKKGKTREGLTVRVKSAKGRKPSSTKWLKRQLNDPFVEKAQKEGYRSRAVYKLQEILDSTGVLKKGAIVVDLGAAPGSWSEIVLEAGAKVIGIDLLPIEPLPGAIFLEGDFTEDAMEHELAALLKGKKVQLVLSDMAANSMGHKETDHLRIMLLLELAVDFAIKHLKPGGSFVGKVLQGGAEKQLLDQLKKHFSKVKHIKPKASRKDSSEMYVLATGFK